MKHKPITIAVLTLALAFMSAVSVRADIIINILAVNGTDVTKVKEISELLPREIRQEDILDTAGLQTAYDVEMESYRVVGSVSLNPKESKTFRIRLRDVWRIDAGEIEQVRQQIDNSYQQVEGTEFFDTAKIKKDSLEQRLDYILNEQSRNADNAGQRIGRYRTYEKELAEIRNQAVSIKYWRSKPPSPDEASIFRLLLEAENPSASKTITEEQRHYLPKEVKPEHIVDNAGFEIRYDPLRGQSFLWKEETLEPGEQRRYEIGIIDIWKIRPQDMENLKDSAAETYRLLENTRYKENADFLVASIKRNLETIEQSQSVPKNIDSHIMDYRANLDYFKQASKDESALEDLLEVVREKLVRSRMENVLERIKSIKGVGDVSDYVTENNSWLTGDGQSILWIIGIVIGVILIGFFVFLSKSKDIKIEDTEEYLAEKEETSV